jgi:hypothetical protein
MNWIELNWIISGVRLSPRGTAAITPIVPAPDDKWLWLWSNWWNEDWQGKLKYSEKTRPNAIVSTINPTWPDPGSNLGRRGGKSATKRLSYGAASIFNNFERHIKMPPALVDLNLKSTIFGDVKSCSVVFYRRFGDLLLPLQSRSLTSKQQVLFFLVLAQDSNRSDPNARKC